MGKVSLIQLTKDNPSFHRRQNLSKSIAEVICNHYCRITTPRELSGFKANQGTTRFVFALRQLQEKCREQSKILFITFVDLTKVYNTVRGKGLRKIIEKLGYPPKLLAMVIQLHDDQLRQVRHNYILSRPFKTTNGLTQRCILAPTFVTPFLTMMLQQVTEDPSSKDGVYIRFHTNGSLFNLRRLQAHTKTKEKTDQ